MFCDFPKYKHLKQTIYRGPGGGGNADSDSEINALTSLTNQALAYSEAAALEADAAAVSAAAASTSAASAATSASGAATSASSASTSATNAASSASAASTSATNAATSATAAAASAASIDPASLVKLTGDQTIGGIKTFSSTIVGSISGNSATATNVAYSGLTGTVPTWNQDTTGNAATATTAINQSSGTVSATSIAYSTTLTGGTGIINIGSGQVYKDASGNVGIGQSSPSQKLDVNGNIVTDSYSLGAGNGIFFRKGFETTAQPSITVEDHSGSAPDGLSVNGADGVSFKTGNTERARIDDSGNLLVGTTDSGKGALTVGKAAPNAAYGQICALSPTAGDSNISGMSVVKYANDSTTAQVLIRFLMNQGSTGQGQINANGANTAAFGSYSDSRLKENIVNLPSQLDSIMALRPVEYDYIESMGGGHQIGFVAQEVQAIYPDLVGEDAEGMLTLTDMNKNDARLIKCIQEQQTIIVSLQDTLTALTARITALETA